jgi:hypothetical protein
VAKGIDHRAFVYFGGETVNVGGALGIDHRGQQGVIAIKRAGVSQSLSPAARRRANWREIRDLAALARILNPEKAGERQDRPVARMQGWPCTRGKPEITRPHFPAADPDHRRLAPLDPPARGLQIQAEEAAARRHGGDHGH